MRSEHISNDVRGLSINLKRPSPWQNDSSAASRPTLNRPPLHRSGACASLGIFGVPLVENESTCHDLPPGHTPGLTRPRLAIKKISMILLASLGLSVIYEIC